MLSLYQLLALDGTEVCEVMNVIYGYERAKIVTRLYGGGFLAQTLGEKSPQYKITLRARSQAEMQAVNAAEADCALLVLNYKGVRSTGYICDRPSWIPVVRGRIYMATVNFAVREEEAAET